MEVKIFCKMEVKILWSDDTGIEFTKKVKAQMSSISLAMPDQEKLFGILMSVPQLASAQLTTDGSKLIQQDTEGKVISSASILPYDFKTEKKIKIHFCECEVQGNCGHPNRPQEMKCHRQNCPDQDIQKRDFYWKEDGQ